MTTPLARARSAEIFNKGQAKIRERRNIEDIIRRSESVGSNIDNLLLDASNIASPTLRQGVQAKVKADEAKRIKDAKQKELERIEKHPDPLGETIRSPFFDIQEKKNMVTFFKDRPIPELTKQFEEDLAAGGVPAEEPVSGEVPVPAGIPGVQAGVPGIEGEVPVVEGEQQIPAIPGLVQEPTAQVPTGELPTGQAPVAQAPTAQAPVDQSLAAELDVPELDDTGGFNYIPPDGFTPKPDTGLASTPDLTASRLLQSPDQGQRNLGSRIFDQKAKKQEIIDKNLLAEDEIVRKHYEEIDKLRDTATVIEDAALQSMQAIREGNTTFWSKPSLKRFVPESVKDAFQNASGQQLHSIMKQVWLNTIKQISAKGLNQYLEQQVQQVYPRIGTAKNAQMSAAKIMIAESRAKKAKIRVSDGIRRYYRERGERVPNNVQEREDKALEPFGEEIQLGLSYDLELLRLSDVFLAKGKNGLRDRINRKVSPGLPLTQLMMRVMFEKLRDINKVQSHAESLGYYFPTPEESARWQDGVEAGL